MSFSNKYLGNLRKIGRKVVLPSDEIKGIMESRIDFSQIKSVLDFGAGSLFWSKYFASKISHKCSNKYSMGGGNLDTKCHESTQSTKPESHHKVFAIDSIYATYRPKCAFSNIFLGTDIFSALRSQRHDLIFMSDVLHHLSPQVEKRVFSAIRGAKYIIIKDIDARHKFGNFMNKAHDRIINGEKVRSIFPPNLQMCLESMGFKLEYFYLPKLWYPHFCLWELCQNHNCKDYGFEIFLFCATIRQKMPNPPRFKPQNTPESNTIRPKLSLQSGIILAYAKGKFRIFKDGAL